VPSRCRSCDPGTSNDLMILRFVKSAGLILLHRKRTRRRKLLIP
jgi:hypothetical protein